MALQDTLCYVGIIVLVSPATIQDTPSCGVFNFESPEIVNDVLYVKETTRVNITFTVQTTNCSNTTFDEIEIFKNDSVYNVFLPHCKIYKTCHHRPEFMKMSCNCLETPGYYSFTFIADRTYNTQWKWSTKQIQDSVIIFDISYQARVNALEIVGYDGYIPRYKPVTVVCTWENGNPPTSVVLLDRHNNAVTRGDSSGNISYTFPHVVCSHAGVIRCEAGRSDRNMSTVMLIECPPEFIKTSTIQRFMFQSQIANITFPFCSHTSNISSCHIYQGINNTNDVINCARAKINDSDIIRESTHCLYSVTGEPPDFFLTIRFRNVNRAIDGVWCVNISNYVGSDLLHFQVNNNGEIGPSQLPTPFITSLIIGIVIFLNILLIIMYNIIKGKCASLRLWGKGKKGTVLYRSLFTDSAEHSQRLSENYYEIHDMQENALQSSSRTSSVHGSEFPFHKILGSGQEQSTNDTNLKNIDSFQAAHGENKNNNQKDNSTYGSQKEFDSQSICTGRNPADVQQVSDNIKRVQTENGTRRPILHHLKIVNIGNEFYNTQ